MSSPTADQVAANVNAGIDDDRTPNTNTFGGAWRALQDFGGNWASDTALEIQNYGDVIGGLFI